MLSTFKKILDRLENINFDSEKSGKFDWIITNTLQELTDTIDSISELEIIPDSKLDGLQLNEEIRKWLTTKNIAHNEQFVEAIFEETVAADYAILDIKVDIKPHVKDVGLKIEQFLDQVCELQQTNIIVAGHEKWFQQFARTKLKPGLEMNIKDNKIENKLAEDALKTCLGDEYLMNAQTIGFQVDCVTYQETGNIMVALLDSSDCQLFPNK